MSMSNYTVRIVFIICLIATVAFAQSKVLPGMMPLLVIFQIPAANHINRIGYKRFVFSGWGTRVLFIFGLHIGVGGLALSIGLGATLNACWLLVGLVRLGVYKPRPGWLVFLAKLLVAALALGACLVWADRSIDWFDRAHPGLRALKMAGVLGGVALVYAAVLTALGVRLKEFVRKA